MNRSAAVENTAWPILRERLGSEPTEPGAISSIQSRDDDISQPPLLFSHKWKLKNSSSLCLFSCFLFSHGKARFFIWLYSCYFLFKKNGRRRWSRRGIREPAPLTFQRVVIEVLRQIRFSFLVYFSFICFVTFIVGSDLFVFFIVMGEMLLRFVNTTCNLVPINTLVSWFWSLTKCLSPISRIRIVCINSEINSEFEVMQTEFGPFDMCWHEY